MSTSLQGRIEKRRLSKVDKVIKKIDQEDGKESLCDVQEKRIFDLIRTVKNCERGTEIEVHGKMREGDVDELVEKGYLRHSDETSEMADASEENSIDVFAEAEEHIEEIYD